MEFTYSIPNQQKLIEAINKAPKEVLREIRVAGKLGATRIQQDARSNHRFISRNGGSGLEGAIETENHDQQLMWKTGLSRTHAPYGDYVHEGTKGGIRTAKKGRGYFQFLGKNGKWYRKKSIKHPGTKPDPFITDAFKNRRQYLNGAFYRAIQNAYKKAFG